MLIAIPLISFILIFEIVKGAGPQQRSGRRESFLCAMVLWGLLIAVSTEILSFLGWLTKEAVILFWILTTLLLGVFYFKFRREAFQGDLTWRLSRTPINRFHLKISRLSLSRDDILCVGMVVVIGIVGGIAFVAPPNNWDSMVYHMSRVMHWIQNRSVAHYSTHELMQLIYPPWAEFAILHLQLLSGDDFFANLVQWSSWVGCLIGASLIAREFGLDRRAQIFSAVLIATLPMAILESSNTKNNVVVSFWLVCFVYFLMKLLSERPLRRHVFYAGMALGLAWLTKVTAYFYSFPFLAWLAAVGLARKSWRPVRFLWVILSVALLLNVGHLSRNLFLFKNPVSDPVSASENLNEMFTFEVLSSNVARNIMLHFASPFKGPNRMLEGLMQKFHGVLKIAISDPSTTYEQLPYHLGGYTFHEDYAGNPLHTILIICCLTWMALWYKKLNAPRPWGYLLSVMGMFVLFNLLIKWNPWTSRYQVPVFVLWAPLMALVIASWKSKRVMGEIGIVLVLCAMPWVFLNQTRGICRPKNIFNTPRTEQYFSASPGFRDSYLAAVQLIKRSGCSRIGLELTKYSWEYPLWVLLREGNRPLRMEHANVKNASRVYQDQNFEPCAIIHDSVGDIGKIWVEFP